MLHHGGQMRKFTNELYIQHPKAVVGILATYMQGDVTAHIMAGGWLHDTVEDTDATLEDIGRVFGSIVQLYVEGMTKGPRGDMNRAEFKASERKRMARLGYGVKSIKLADVIHNSLDVVKQAPSFAKVYLPEQELLVEEALTGGHPRLLTVAREIIRAEKKKLS